MLGIQLFEVSGLPATPAAQVEAVEKCFKTVTFHIDCPDRNRYFVAQVTEANPIGIRSLASVGADDPMYERVMETLKAMILSGPNETPQPKRE